MDLKALRDTMAIAGILMSVFVAGFSAAFGRLGYAITGVVLLLLMIWAWSPWRKPVA